MPITLRNLLKKLGLPEMLLFFQMLDTLYLVYMSYVTTVNLVDFCYLPDFPACTF